METINISYSKDKLRKILLETFKTFDSFCSENKIQYIGAYGTVLGAVRHKGIIPWDDDIDVYMTRENYDRFLQLKEKANKTKYKIVDIHDEGYYTPFAKFYDSETTLWELESIPFVIGIFIDIFPLDHSCDTIYHTKQQKKQISKWFWRYMFSLRNDTIHSIIHNLIQKDFYGFRVSLKFYVYHHLFFAPFKQKLKNKYLSLIERAKSNTGKDYIYYTTVDCLGKSIFKKEWIENTITVRFEDTTIKIPEKYDEYLTYLYGNYMQPPEPSKRKSHHYHYFVDLEQGMTVQQIIQKIKGKPM